jgi:hypothetical protein
MKHLLLTTGLMMGAMTVAVAQQKAPTASNRASPEVTEDSNLSSIYTDGKCHFRFKVAAEQRYDTGMYMFDPTKDMPVGWGFGIGCRAGASQDDIDGQVGAKFVGGKWIDENSGSPFDSAQQLKVYDFSGKNWTGKGIAYSQIYGDETRRQRLFNFCLIQNKGPQVLCGQTQVRNLSAPSSTSTLPKIMAVLKTIEFVDQPAILPSAPTAPVRH